MSRIPLELADDTHELRDDEYTLDAEDFDATQRIVLRPHRSRQPPPPPPPRRSLRTASDHASGQHSARNRSGVFSVADAAAAIALANADPSAELARLRAQMRARDAYLLELERALEEHTQQLTAAGLNGLDDIARLLGRVRGQAFRIAELESELRRMATKLSERASDQRRDETDPSAVLRRVRGIGPRYAQQLYALGITHVAQLAAWTEADVARIAAELHVAPSRIARQRWVEQAAALAIEDELEEN